MFEISVSDVSTSVTSFNHAPAGALLSTANSPSGDSLCCRSSGSCLEAVSDLHEAALRYHELGLPIELCYSGGTKPFNTIFPRDTWTPQSIDSLFADHPQANVGLVLGSRSGLVCIVCDGEAAEEMFHELFDNEVVETPTWRSNRRLHRLFQWQPILASLGKSQIILQGRGAKLEILIGSGVHTLLPPSSSGRVRLEWVTGQALAPAILPDSVLKKLGCRQPEDVVLKNNRKQEKVCDQKAHNANSPKKRRGQQACLQDVFGTSLYELLLMFEAHVVRQYSSDFGGHNLGRICRTVHQGLDHGYPLCCVLAYVEETASKQEDCSYERRLVSHPTEEGRLMCLRCAAQMGLIDPITGPQRPDRWVRCLKELLAQRGVVLPACSDDLTMLAGKGDTDSSLSEVRSMGCIEVPGEAGQRSPNSGAQECTPSNKQSTDVSAALITTMNCSPGRTR